MEEEVSIMVSVKKIVREKREDAKVCLSGTWVRKQKHAGKQRCTESQILSPVGQEQTGCEK